MQMLYNSDTYVVVLYEDSTVTEGAAAATVAGAVASPRIVDAAMGMAPPSGWGGYELVDKFAGRGIYLSGSLAETFKLGVDSLIGKGTSEDDIDAYIESYSALMQQPVVLH